MDEGTTRPLHIHAYPKSSGIVIRVIGRAIDQNCGAVAEAAREAVLAARFLGFFCRRRSNSDRRKRRFRL